jgi:hypothetical protein
MLKISVSSLFFDTFKLKSQYISPSSIGSLGSRFWSSYKYCRLLHSATAPDRYAIWFLLAFTRSSRGI